MNSLPAPAPQPGQVVFAGEVMDERLALFLADLAEETYFDIIDAEISKLRISEDGLEPGEPVEVVTFTFDNSGDASDFIEMIGTVWPETRGLFSHVGPHAPLTWGTHTVTLLEEEIDEEDLGEPGVYECEGCGEEHEIDDEAGYHFILGVCVYLPLGDLPELTQRFFRYSNPEAEAGLEGIDLEQLLSLNTEPEDRTE